MNNRYFAAKSLVYSAGLGRSYQNFWWKRRVQNFCPWTDWNREKKAVFVHIPKTGGTSMYKTFGMDDPGETHCPAIGYSASDPNAWNSAFRFAFVRNPWDRFVSAFHYLKQKPLTDDDRRWAEQMLSDCDDFEAFIARMVSSPTFRGSVMMWRHFSPQWWYLTDQSGESFVDYVGRFENFDAELDEISSKLGISPTRVHKNKVARSHYSEYYTPETVKFVRGLYQTDIERYKYEF